jgi:D-beta-D-heptose 7-phosphate kinase / D-beta-D-heptose 1-phosphate adenosyltransferase
MKPKIAVFGDVLLDRYDYCENRENPESSAPCHRVKKTTFLPGGAGNVAANLAKLGAEVTLFGIVGNDEHGKQLIDELSNLGVNQKILTDDNINTIVKQRILSAHDGRYHGRLDFGDSSSEIESLKSLKSQILFRIAPLLANGFDSCIISDYDKGFITPELVNEIKKIGVPIYVDPKQNKALYYGVELIKPNKKEISSMSGLVDYKEKANEISKELKTNVLLTLGGDGMYFAGKDGNSFSLPANKTEVVDVTGCGDTALATLVFYRTIGRTMKESIELANKAAGIGVQHIGCYQVSREEIESFNDNI